MFCYFLSLDFVFGLSITGLFNRGWQGSGRHGHSSVRRPRVHQGQQSRAGVPGRAHCGRLGRHHPDSSPGLARAQNLAGEAEAGQRALRDFARAVHAFAVPLRRAAPGPRVVAPQARAGVAVPDDAGGGPGHEGPRSGGGGRGPVPHVRGPRELGVALARDGKGGRGKAGVRRRSLGPRLLHGQEANRGVRVRELVAPDPELGSRGAGRLQGHHGHGHQPFLFRPRPLNL